jgi:hypothetical protein
MAVAYSTIRRVPNDTGPTLSSIGKGKQHKLGGPQDIGAKRTQAAVSAAVKRVAIVS